MLPMKPLRNVTLAALLCLAACQTPSAGGSSVDSRLISEAVAAGRAEICRGQTPQDLASLRYTVDGIEKTGVTEAEFWAAPEWMRAYIVGNDAQWEAAGCDKP
jgi:hypothetical protein